MKNKLKKYKWVIVCLALFIILIYLVYPKNTTDNSGLPRYALKSAKIKEAYLFAKENPRALTGVNCYCGCMQHPHQGRIHSKGLHDCFLNGNNFDMHGSQCDMCVNDALQVKSMIGMGMEKEEIKKAIDEKYA